MSEARTKQLIPGLFLIIVGCAFLLKNMDILPPEIERHLFGWESWLIMIGSVFLIARPSQPTGLILIVIGMFFLLPDIFNWHFNMRMYWPLILIVVGIFFLLRQRRDVPDAPNKLKGDSSMDVLDDTSVFGGGDVVVTSDNFKGGKVTYVFGGSSVNLSRAKISQGKAVIDVFIMFGGTSFIVPSDWNVRNEVTSIFGGFSDERKPAPGTVIDEKKELIIKGTVLFGGGDIKNFA
jgi:predicted membrane protein